MAKLGDITKVRDIYHCRPGNKGNNKLVWHACIDCGKERWVLLLRGKPKSLYCRSCKEKGERNPTWKGWRKTIYGYIQIHLEPSDFFYSMASKSGYVYEHRLVMARYLGRCLHLWEIVHHKGTKYPLGSKENKSDNRIENLQLVSDDRHKQITVLEIRIKQLEQRVTMLEAENILLREAINEGTASGYS